MYFIIDCESSGVCPMYGDLIEFAVISETGAVFKSAKFPPLCNHYDEGAYKALGITRAEHEAYTGDVKAEFKRLEEWLGEFTGKCIRPTAWSDNIAYDWQWINWGFAHAGTKNPFGYSGRRIGDLFSGVSNDIRNQRGWKRWRRTKHTHDPVDDVRGNLEAFQEIRKRFKL